MAEVERQTETICAVVVTYNRKNLLKVCLDGLLSQSRPLDHIIIIDNASSDGTKELLLEKYLEKPIFDYVRLSENTGGAGGFSEGMRLGYQKGFDWLWVLDDDVKAHPDALDNLLIYSDVSKCIHPRKYYENGQAYLWEHKYDLKKLKVIWLNDVSLEDRDYAFVDACCFEGMLIHRSVIEKAGFPEKRFFIVGDDIEYGLRVNKYTNILYTKQAGMTKLITAGKSVYKLGRRKVTRLVSSPSGQYYFVRNLFLLKGLHKVSVYQDISTILWLIRKFISILIFDDRKVYRWGLIVRGYVDGIRGKFGPL